MTYEDATERIKCILKNNSFTRADKNALKLAIEALEKQIPKKPIFEREQTSPFGVDDVPYCPNCKCSLPEVSYCEEFGQAIDWEASE